MPSVKEINANRAALVAQGKDPYSGAGATAYSNATASLRNPTTSTSTSASSVAPAPLYGDALALSNFIKSMGKTSTEAESAVRAGLNSSSVPNPNQMGTQVSKTTGQTGVLDTRTQAINNLKAMGYANPDEGEIQGAIVEIPKVNAGIVTGNETETKYKQALTALGSTTPPDATGDGRAKVTTALSTIPNTETSPAISNFLNTITAGEDKDWQAILDTQKAYEEESYTSLQDTYNELTKNSGIEAMDTSLMNMKNVIEGTEDDIRTEVEKASGFATDSQVLAMATARNKSLIKNYNNLLEQRNAIESHIDKQMAFAGQDKTNALNALTQRMGFQMKVIEYKDKAQSNAREALNNVVTAVGYAGLSQMVGTDPRYIAKAESILGLAPGGLANLASIADTGDYQFISGTDNQPMGVFDKSTGTFKSLGGGGGGSTPNMAGLTPEQQADPFIQKMLASKGGKPITDTFAQSLNKGLNVLSQIGGLQTNVNDTDTGPIVGLFRGANPWDTNAQTIKAQLNAIVPNLARGVYGEVGVLTDNDIKNYSQTLPNLKSTEDVRNAVLGITVDLIGKSIKRTLEINAANGKDVSGFIDIYTEMTNTRDSIFSKIPGYKGNTVGQVPLTPEDNSLADSVLGSASSTPTSSSGSWWKDLTNWLGF